MDGYPRTIAQVNDLVNLLKSYKIEIDNIINIEVPNDELLKRAKKRAETSTREDDKNPETHYKRIRVFEEQTKPTIDYMKKKFKAENFLSLKSYSKNPKKRGFIKNLYISIHIQNSIVKIKFTIEEF